MIESWPINPVLQVSPGNRNSLIGSGVVNNLNVNVDNIVIDNSRVVNCVVRTIEQHLDVKNDVN